MPDPTTRARTFSGPKLKRLRTKAKMSQTDLGLRLYQDGASRSPVLSWVIEKYEAGTTVPTGNRIGALAAIFGVRVDTLYTSS